MRSGYTDHCGGWALLRWRFAVDRELLGERGQAFLREMLVALDALPAPRLIAYELEEDGEVCAIGSVGTHRGIDMSHLDPLDYTAIADAFGIAEPMVREIEFINDEAGWWDDTPEQRFERVRAWVVENLHA